MTWWKKVTAKNKCHLRPKTKHFNYDESDFFQDDYAPFSNAQMVAAWFELERRENTQNKAPCSSSQPKV